jgi:predicted transcriptional regulator
MSELDGQKYLDILMGSETRVDLLTLFHKNPGIMDTQAGIARRLGLVSEAIQYDLDEISKLGIITKKKLGTSELFFLNRTRDRQIQQSIGSYLQTVKPQI